MYPVVKSVLNDICEAAKQDKNDDAGADLGACPPRKFLILMPSRLILLHSQPILKPKIMAGYANDKPVS